MCFSLHWKFAHFVEAALATETVLRLSDASLAPLLQALHWDQLIEAAQHMLEQFRVDRFMLKMSIFDGEGGTHQHAFGSLPPHILDRFRSSEQDGDDSIMRHVVRTGVPLEWLIDPVCAQSPPSQPYHCLREFGVTSGFSMAQRGDRSFSRIDFYCSNGEPLAQSSRYRAELFLFGSYLNEAAKLLWAKHHPRALPLLTAREQQCLQWSASGKTSQEIGIILGISQHTVYFHLKKVASKLNVYGTRHAISRATEMGLVRSS